MKASARDSELTAALIEAYNGDEDTKKIARDLGYACARSLCNVWRNMGLSASKRAARTQSEIEAAIFARADAGDSVRAIAKVTGLDFRAVKKIIAQRNAPPPEPKVRFSCAPAARQKFFDTYGDGPGAVARYQATREARA